MFRDEKCKKTSPILFSFCVVHSSLGDVILRCVSRASNATLSCFFHLFIYFHPLSDSEEEIPGDASVSLALYTNPPYVRFLFKLEVFQDLQCQL